MKTHGPWKILSSSVKYKNPWIQVVEDSVIRPDGKPGIYGTVKIKGGVSVLPIDENGFVYLTREFHYAVARKTIETVSGGIDKNETPLTSAQRELKEELGIAAKKWNYFGITNSLSAFTNHVSHLYLARELSFGPEHHEGTETLEPLKMKFNKAVEMVMHSEITHASSCTLILKAKGFLNL